MCGVGWDCFWVGVGLHWSLLVGCLVAVLFWVVIVVFCLVFVAVGFWAFAGFVFCGLFAYVLWLLFANCVVGFGVVCLADC